MTGKPMRDSSEGIWDDGEWVSWEYINGQLYENEIREEYPEANPDVAMLFEDLVRVAAEYKVLTGRYLQIWGELGEVYAEVKFGIKRHKPSTQGSDGRLGNDFIEVKTISPEKGKAQALVKRAGNFNKLLVVRISEDFKFEARMIDRKSLKKGAGNHAKVKWDAEQE
jgi:hypothetical protein